MRNVLFQVMKYILFLGFSFIYNMYNNMIIYLQ